MQSLTKSTPTARALGRAPLLFCAALLSAGLALTGCDEEDDPFEGILSPVVDAGNTAGTTGGTGGTGGNVGAPGGTTGGNVGALGGTTGGSTGLPSGTGGATGGNPGTPGGNPGIPQLDAGATAGGGTTGGATGDAGTGSSDASSGTQGDAASGDASGPPPRADLGKGDGSDVLMIGDSWMSLLGAESGIQGGVLKASMQPYRAVAIPGTTLLGGGALDFLGDIPTQWQGAVRADPDIKTVIMTAGGNDILQTNLQEDCMNMGEACAAQVMKILDGLTKLWGEMAKANVQDIVYILYATPEGKTVDFLLPDGDGARKRCAAVPAPTRCHIQETLDIVMGDIPDSIHPSQAASDRIGKAVVDLMAARGMRR